MKKRRCKTIVYDLSFGPKKSVHSNKAPIGDPPHVIGLPILSATKNYLINLIEGKVILTLLVHSVIFMGEMQTKFYCKNIGTIVIFDKKIFKFLCHMIGSNHY